MKVLSLHVKRAFRCIPFFITSFIKTGVFSFLTPLSLFHLPLTPFLSSPSLSVPRSFVLKSWITHYMQHNFGWFGYLGKRPTWEMYVASEGSARFDFYICLSTVRAKPRSHLLSFWATDILFRMFTSLPSGIFFETRTNPYQIRTLLCWSVWRRFHWKRT